jgi:protein-disulfide isomerase
MIRIVLCMLVVCVSLKAHAVDASGLSASAKAVYQKVATEEFCGCDSPLTVAGCLQKYPGCGIGKQLSSVIAKGAQANIPADELMAFMSQHVTGPFCAKPKMLDVSKAPSQGNPKAPITLVEFADFRCSHCKKAVPTVHQAVVRMGSKVRLVFVPFPLQPASESAAEAAMEAHAQGKFWPMHALLFQHQGEYTDDVLDACAKKAGLNIKKYKAAMANHTHKATVKALRDMGVAAGIEGTPAFFINGRRFEPDMTLFDFNDRLALETVRKQGGCK